MPAGRMEACSGNCGMQCQLSSLLKPVWQLEHALHDLWREGLAPVASPASANPAAGTPTNHFRQLHLYPAWWPVQGRRIQLRQSRISNGCMGWCWVRVLCRKNGKPISYGHMTRDDHPCWQTWLNERNHPGHLLIPVLFHALRASRRPATECSGTGSAAVCRRV